MKYKIDFLKKNNVIKMIIVGIIIIVLLLVLYSERAEKRTQLDETTTVSECVSLSKEVRINEKTKECFSKLSTDEFLSLMNNEENMKLYNEVNAYYDKRTEAQKAEDAKKTEEYMNEVIKNLETNPDAYKK
jgi:hypothetical protein